MKMKRFIYILSAASVVFLFSACDYLLPLPLGRDNPDDDNYQIRKFNASISGTTAVNTIWNWQPPSVDIPDDQIIDKIRIVHKENDPPSSVNPIDKQEYVDIDTSSVWEFQWDNLKQGREHYFALYAHEKGGAWLAPKYGKLQLDYNETTQNDFLQTDNTNTIDDPRNFQVYSVDSAFNSSDVTTDPGFALNPGNYLILNFKLYRYVYFTQFIFHLENSVFGSDVNITIVPIKKGLGDVVNITEFLSGSVLDYDYEITKHVLSVDGANQSIELNNFPNRMFLYDIKALVIYVDNPLTLNIDNWGIDVKYWGDLY